MRLRFGTSQITFWVWHFYFNCFKIYNNPNVKKKKTVYCICLDMQTNTNIFSQTFQGEMFHNVTNLFVICCFNKLNHLI